MSEHPKIGVIEHTIDGELTITKFGVHPLQIRKKSVWNRALYFAKARFLTRSFEVQYLLDNHNWDDLKTLTSDQINERIGTFDGFKHVNPINVSIIKLNLMTGRSIKYILRSILFDRIDDSGKYCIKNGNHEDHVDFSVTVVDMDDTDDFKHQY